MGENLLEGKLHCDRFYIEGVCPSRKTIEWTAFDKELICTTQGQTPLEHWELCWHCIELKPYFRHKPSRKTRTIKA